MSQSQQIKKLLLDFSRADRGKLYNFTCGHIGALPISDKKLSELIGAASPLTKKYIYLLILGQSLIFIFYSILPVKNMALIVRTMVRRFCNQTQAFHATTVLSLGASEYNKDAYFGPLLASMPSKFNYLKIVGGYTFKSDGFQFVEAGLSWIKTLSVVFKIILTPVFSLLYLVNQFKRLSEANHRLIFILLSLKEINSGSFNSNLIICASICGFLTQSKTTKLIYPMEGRSWEKRVVSFSNLAGIRTIGYVHCALTPRHFSLIHQGFYDSSNSPSVIVAPSEMSAQILKKVFSESMVRKGFFLRANKGLSKISPKEEGMLIFALTGSIEESCTILDGLAKTGIHNLYKVFIRLNQNTSTYGYLVKYVEKLQINLYDQTNNSLPQLCFFRSSSVALDYLRLNVTPIYISLDEVISNNIFELDSQYGFKTLDICGDILSQVDFILANEESLEMPGGKVAQYYLDQEYNSTQLMSLLD